MNRILQVYVDDFDATLEAGVTLQQLNDHLRDSGVFFSVDPGAATQTTLGGMAASSKSRLQSIVVRASSSRRQKDPRTAPLFLLARLRLPYPRLA